MGKSICKNISKNWRGKYSQKFLTLANQSATDALNTASKKPIQKLAEATGDLIGNKISDKITKDSRRSQQNNSQRVEIETKNRKFDREIPKKDIYLQKRDIKLLTKSKVKILA